MVPPSAHQPTNKNVKLSARNVIKGIIKDIKEGPISTLAVIEIAPGVEIVSVITTEGADSLRLEIGQSAYAIIKASNVMLGKDD